MNKQTAWVIMRDDGKFLISSDIQSQKEWSFNNRYSGSIFNIRKDCLFLEKKHADVFMCYIKLKNCRAVKIEIKVVEE